MERLSKTLNELKNIRRELSEPSSIWRLAKYLKKNSRPLDVNATDLIIEN
ncbi:hypothetical protein GCM10022421_31000 [Oceanisphaera sediminis]|uniref:Uncharacterized protein n=1 Tax=Oceanisphaera sediminis TaxID=981381 RepID=A0ABP7ER20_9GAMM